MCLCLNPLHAGTIEHHFLREFERPAEFSTIRPGLQPPGLIPSAAHAGGQLHQHVYQQHLSSSQQWSQPNSGTAARNLHSSSGEQQLLSHAPAGEMQHLQCINTSADSAVLQAATKAVGVTTTQKGVPCFTVPALVQADIVNGKPLQHQPAADEAWRTARVKAYPVPVAR